MNFDSSKWYLRILRLHIASAPSEFLPKRRKEAGSMQPEELNGSSTAPDGDGIPGVQRGLLLSISGQDGGQA